MDIQPINAFIMHRQPTNSWSAFVEYWAKAYDYLDDNKDYDDFVVSRDSTFTFDENKLRKLFEWKNKTGDKLTTKKETTLQKIVSQQAFINQLRTQWDEDAFRSEFGKVSIVWQTYLMHIIQPDRFPIFDQHVYRAYTYLQTGQSDELQRFNTTKQKSILYKQYQSFFETVKKDSGSSSRDIDKAFWAFGRFIKQYPSLL